MEIRFIIFEMNEVTCIFKTKELRKLVKFNSCLITFPPCQYFFRLLKVVKNVVSNKCEKGKYRAIDNSVHTEQFRVRSSNSAQLLKFMLPKPVLCRIGQHCLIGQSTRTVYRLDVILMASDMMLVYSSRSFEYEKNTAQKLRFLHRKPRRGELVVFNLI